MHIIPTYLSLHQDPVSQNFTLGGVAFVPPSMPVLLQILSGKTAATDLLPSGSVYTFPPNKVIEISIPGGGNVSALPSKNADTLK